MERRFFTLDVFTTTRFEGNPLAVITDGDGLSPDAMLAIARELNLPIRYIGVGEQAADLLPFEPEAFIDSLFAQ